MKKLLLLYLICLSQFLFPQADTRYDADKNLPFNEKAGDINPQTGNLTLKYTDLSLPGRGGMGFSFGRVWSINQSNVYNMYLDSGTYTNRLSSDTIERVNHMGVGWSANIPYILDDDKSGELVKTLFFGGGAYQIDHKALSFQNGAEGNEKESNLSGYDLLDMRIYHSTEISYGDVEGGLPEGYDLSDRSEDVSYYVLIKKDNSRDYFRKDGRLMMSQDRSGRNRIWYFYTKPYLDGQARLGLVVDTVGRHISFSYNSDGCLESLSWDVVMGTKEGELRSVVTQRRTIRYEYENLENYPLVQEIKQLLYPEDREESFALKSVYDEMSYETRYSYKEAGAMFTFNSQKPRFENVYILLASVSSYYNKTTGSYLNKRCFEYDIPAKGLYTKYFYNGFMENHRISRQYYLDRHKRINQDTSYIYNSVGENSNQYTTVIKSKNSRKRYVYLESDVKNLHHVLKSIVVETDDGYLERRDFLYDENRARVQEDVYRRGKWVYREKSSFDKKGNLERFEDKAGLVTYTTYDEKFSLPVFIVKTVSVEDEKKEYISENEIDPHTGNIQAVHVRYTGKADPLHGGIEKELVSTTSYEYDLYGNRTREIDPLGNSINIEYDEETHSFPVKVWQDVSIDTWGDDGGVHAHWMESPRGKQLVRLRSWNLYNSDGTVWLEIDNEGYATEHYYNPLGDEVEIVSPGSDDIRDFALPLRVDENGNIIGEDFNDFLYQYLKSPDSVEFSSYFSARENNPGSRIYIDYENSVIRKEIDMDKARGAAKVTERKSDGLGNVLEEVEYGEDGDQYTKYMVYDDLGRMIALTDQDRGNFLGKKDIHQTSFDRYERTWIIEYDDLGRQKQVTYPVTAPGSLDTKTFIYNDIENSMEVIDSEGRRFYELHDWKGNVLESVAYGTEKTPRTEILRNLYEYDELGRRVKFTDAGGVVTRYRYDERDLLVKQDYGEGRDLMEYNSLGLLIKNQDPKGQFITLEYDEMGRNTLINNYLNHEDLLNAAPESAIKISYDNRGNSVRIENNNLIEHYLYDCSNRVVSLQRRLKDESLRNILVSSGWGGSAENQIFDFHYTYNNVGMVRSMVFPDGNIHSFEYNNITGWLERIKDGDEDFITRMEYNKSGVVTRMEYSNNTWQHWDFDNRKRIKRTSIGKNENTFVDMSYSLNGAGNILGINDNEYMYDDFNRIKSAKTLIPGNKNLKKLVWKHFGSYADDLVGKLNGEAVRFNPEADLNSDGRVNGIDHIIVSGIDESQIYDIESFSYDKNGNRTRLIQNGEEYLYTYGARNRLECVEKKPKDKNDFFLFMAYTYDPNGNTLGRTVFESDGVTVKTETSFKYDVENRLVESVEFREGKTSVTVYAYDNAGNRFIKKNEEGITLYLRHGQIAVAMDLFIPGEEFDFKDDAPYTAKVNRYVLSGDLLAGRVTRTIKAEAAEETSRSWYHLDHLNSTKCITGEEGEVEVLYEYRAFGEQLKKLGEEDSLYTYAGKELDSGTDLYYFNARYYDASIGRFINLDPVQDGTNWYVYCNNNPLAFVDPTGLYDIITGAVEDGDTLSEITAELNEFYGTEYSYDDIAEINGIEDPDKIYTGSTVRIGTIDGAGNVWQPPENAREVTSGYWNNLTEDQQRIQHYHRNIYQSNAGIPQNQADLNMDEWIDRGIAAAHNLNGATGNRDFRGTGVRLGQQAIYDANGRLVTDPANVGTFDYISPTGPISFFGHRELDIRPWIRWGNSPQDPTTPEQRRNEVPWIAR